MRELPATIRDRLPKLFWAVDLARLDPELHEDFVFARLLNEGDWSVVRALRDAVGDDALAAFVRRAGRRLDRRTRRFFEVVLSIPAEPATIHAEVLGVRTSLLAFPYAPLEPPLPTAEGVPVASLRDIAAMKIEAIASRGARKDFYDLYFICQAGLSLDAAFDAFRDRFASATPDIYHRIRALTFFDDAEREPELMLLRPAHWSEVRAFFETEARRLWTAP
jgi:hypothetical protein